MLKSKKHVFWEALLIAVIIFIFGFLIGISYESSNLIKINDFYISSEIDLADELAVIQLMNTDKFDCKTLEQTNDSTKEPKTCNLRQKVCPQSVSYASDFPGPGQSRLARQTQTG